MVIVPTGQVLRKQIKSYLPDFSQAFEHVCIHTGGRGVIDEMEKQLKLSPALMAPSRDTLYRFGNTSSSSIWCVRHLRSCGALQLHNAVGSALVDQRL